MSLGGCGGSPWARTGWVWISVAHEQSVCQLLVLADQGTGVGPSQTFSVRSCAAELYYIVNMTAVSLWHLIMKSHLKVQGQGLSLNAKPFVCCYGNTFLSLHCQNGTPIIWHNRLETKNIWSVSTGKDWTITPVCPYSKFLMESSTIPQERKKQTVMIQVSRGMQTTAISILIYIYFVLLRHAANRQIRQGCRSEWGCGWWTSWYEGNCISSIAACHCIWWHTNRTINKVKLYSI